MGRQLAFPAITGMVFIILSVLPCFGLDGVSFRAALEKEKIKLGEKVQFLIIVNYGTGTMAPAVNAPSFVQFNVLAENEVTQEKGEGPEKYKILKKIWLLEPAETGRLSIASAIITYQDPTSNLLQTGKTDVLFLQVDPVGEGAAAKSHAESNAATTSAQALHLNWELLAGIGGGLAVIVVLGLLLGKQKPAAPKVVPEDLALGHLQDAIGHAEAENLEQYYAALSRTLADYILNKFGLDPNVLGTQSLLEKLSGLGVLPANIQGLRDFFQVADKAKFAGYVPDEDKMIELHATVNQFIEAGRKLKIKRLPEKQKKKSDEDED